MEKITGTVITLNEEHNIGPCVESLLRVCDEVVVVDSGSSRPYARGGGSGGRACLRATLSRRRPPEELRPPVRQLTDGC